MDLGQTAAEVGRYRITLTTTEDEYRSVLTCKDCDTAPVLWHPELVVRDPPTRRGRRSALLGSFLRRSAMRSATMRRRAS